MLALLLCFKKKKRKTNFGGTDLGPTLWWTGDCGLHVVVLLVAMMAGQRDVVRAGHGEWISGWSVSGHF